MSQELDHNSLRKVVFDIETKKTFEEVGGYENREELGVSYVGVYSYSQDKLYGFFEDELENLEKILIAEKPMLIGFNSLHFDNPVLQPYFQTLDLSTLPHLDILKEVEAELGHRLKLESIATSTLYSGKSGSGLDAIRWYREGDYDSLAKYCIDDVRVTRDVYEFGRRHGKLYFNSGSEKKPVAVNWALPETIEQKVDDAFKHHKQLVTTYIEVDDSGKATHQKRTLEIVDREGDVIEAFCTELNKKTRFFISRIWNIEETGGTYAHQSTML